MIAFRGLRSFNVNLRSFRSAISANNKYTCNYKRLARYFHIWEESPFTMMTSSNGNIFRVTGLLCGEFTGEFPSQRPVRRSFDDFFDLGLNKRLSKQSWGWWFETPSCSLWRHRNDCLPTRKAILIGMSFASYLKTQLVGHRLNAIWSVLKNSVMDFDWQCSFLGNFYRSIKIN